MKLFQNSGLYPAYLTRLNQLAGGSTTFAQRRQVFLADRFGASHFLKPVLDAEPDAFFTNGDDATLQRLWAREHGLPEKASLEDILLAQIEAHRTEVFYNVDPMRYASAFLKRLPGTVRTKIAWRAAPSPGVDFNGYDLVVCNFNGILDGYRRAGLNAAWFAPAHDPVMDTYAANTDRPTDVLFVGGYSRHHRRRAAILESVAARNKHLNIVFHLDRSRLTRLAESPLGRLLPMRSHRRPQQIRAVAAEPVFGIDLYAAFSTAKIVLNGAVDMAGQDRGNMRCFEAMGCGALMVSDAGNYPAGMVNGQTMRTYADADEATTIIETLLADPITLRTLAESGHRTVAHEYGKAQQWQAFQQLVGAL